MAKGGSRGSKIPASPPPNVVHPPQPKAPTPPPGGGRPQRNVGIPARPGGGK
jgi:hypothetical protein